MVQSFHVEIPGLIDFVARFKGADKIIADELSKAGKRAGLAVEAQAKRYAPVWRGDLRRSITSVSPPFGTTVSPMGSVTRVGTTKIYAAAMEFGRPAGAPMPPPGALLPWMAAKGIAADEQFVGRSDVGDMATTKRAAGGYHGIEYLIARSIKRSAPKPRPFLFKAFNELKPKIRAEFAEVPRRVIARLQGGG